MACRPAVFPSLSHRRERYRPEDKRFINAGALYQRGEYEGAIGISTYNDEAYIMSTDYSIYKVKTDKLMENIDKTDIEAMEVNADNDTLELVVDSKDIKQTGVNNLNDITSFKVAGDDRFIVFDSFDNVYKMISKE